MGDLNPDQDRFSWIAELFRLGGLMVQDDLELARHQILEHTVRGFSATSGTLALSNNDRTSLTIVASVHLPLNVLGQIVPYGKGIMGLVAERGEALLLSGDITKDLRYEGLVAPRENKRPSSAICWPLIFNAQVIGVMSLNRGVEEQPFSDKDIEEGLPIINLMALVIENARLNAHRHQYILELRRLNDDLKSVNGRLEDAHNQLLQSEKMASMGQLAAGVAHEINNPVGYINSNLTALQKYILDLMRLVDCYVEAEHLLPAESAESASIRRIKSEVELDFLRQDLNDLMRESQEGVERVRKIVQDLKEFSHVDSSEWQVADLHRGLESTLNIVHNEIKYKAEIVKEYGDMPEVECIPSQINQVFLNLLVNAAQAIEKRGVITLRTGTTGGEIWIEVKDTGKGISPHHLNRIFEPFFTTKEVGKGTGLGLSLSWNIVQRHGGRLEVQSTAGEGSTFRLTLPIHANKAATGAT